MTVALVIAGAAAALDWLAVVRGWDRIESIAKPAVMLALIGVAAAGDRSLIVSLVIAGLALSMIGDVLLLPTLDRFEEGLAAFLLAHVAYLVGFVSAGQTPGLLLLGIAATSAITVIAGRPILEAATATDERLGPPVLAYLLALAAMASAAAGTGLVVVAAGAFVFAASDGVLGWNRFVGAIRHGRLLTHVLYHTGQALIVVGVVDR